MILVGWEKNKIKNCTDNSILCSLLSFFFLLPRVCFVHNSKSLKCIEQVASSVKKKKEEVHTSMTATEQHNRKLNLYIVVLWPSLKIMYFQWETVAQSCINQRPIKLILEVRPALNLTLLYFYPLHGHSFFSCKPLVTT